MTTLQTFHRAVEAYVQLQTAEARIAALKAEIETIQRAVEEASAICRRFVDEIPDGAGLLEKQYALLRRARLVQEVGIASRREGVSVSVGTLPRTAAATAAAAARRRAIREANPDQKRIPRSKTQRLAFFDAGFMAGYRAYAENQGARNPFGKGDRYRGWAIGAQKAAEDIAAGIITPGTPNAHPTSPEQARAGYELELTGKGVPDDPASNAG